jgi:ribosomal protein L20A (L18A)
MYQQVKACEHVYKKCGNKHTLRDSTIVIYASTM